MRPLTSSNVYATSNVYGTSNVGGLSPTYAPRPRWLQPVPQSLASLLPTVLHGQLPHPQSNDPGGVIPPRFRTHSEPQLDFRPRAPEYPQMAYRSQQEEQGALGIDAAPYDVPKTPMSYPQYSPALQYAARYHPAHQVEHAQSSRASAYLSPSGMVTAGSLATGSEQWPPHHAYPPLHMQVPQSSRHQQTQQENQYAYQYPYQRQQSPLDLDQEYEQS